ncbi:MAG: hypothetical protein ACREL7_15290 [Longimicrobiales bacterium]
MPTPTDLRRSALAPAPRGLPRRALFAATVIAASCSPARVPPRSARRYPPAPVYPGAACERIGDPEAAGWLEEGLARVRMNFSTRDMAGVTDRAGALGR